MIGLLVVPDARTFWTQKVFETGRIEAEQDDTHQPHSGVMISDVDWKLFAESLGVTGYTVTTIAELTKVLGDVKDTTEPVLIDLKMTDDRQLPVEKFAAYRDKFEDLEEFLKEYEASELEMFADILARHQVPHAGS